MSSFQRAVSAAMNSSIQAHNSRVVDDDHLDAVGAQ